MKAVKEIMEMLESIREEVREVKDTVDLLREAQPEADITHGLSSILSYDGKGKRDEA